MVAPPSPSTVRVSLQQISPDLDLWSDASDVGWGAHLGSLTASSLWDQEQSALYQRQRASCRPRGPPPLPVFSGREECVSVLRQQHSGVLSPQGGRHVVTLPQLADSGDFPLDRIPLDPPGSPVHPEVSQRAGELSLSPSPATAYRVVPLSGGFSIFKSSVAGPNRLICNIRQSPLFHLFLSLPGSDGCGHRRVPSTLGRSSGLRISSVVHHSTSSGETPDVPGDGLTLVAPYWPQRTWFADLLHLSLAPPVALPLRQDLLRLPRSHCLYQGLHRLRLHAWRLSGASRELQDSHPR